MMGNLHVQMMLTQPGETAITPYVKIDAQGITLITPRADVGQGAWSMQAHMIAEELDIDPRSAKLSPGPADAIYYNGVVGAEALPIAATSDTMLARGGRGAVDVMGKLMGLHITGGSSTVPSAADAPNTSQPPPPVLTGPRRRSAAWPWALCG